MKTVYRDGKKENGRNAHFHYCFQRMKSISSPWRRVGGFVMHQMKNPENFWMMHQPVCPVKIGIMNDEHEWEGGIKIKQAMFINVVVKCSVW
jgi:hypothetical protein